MDELYMNFHQNPSMVSPPGGNYQSMAAFGDVPVFATDNQHHVLVSNLSEMRRGSHDDDDADDHISSAIRAKIAQHPLFSRLVQAYVDCQKVGAPPEIVSILDKILQESNVCKVNSVVSSSCFGADPELDDFMETYCNLLVKYKSDLSEPFNEATLFLSKIEVQLKDLCNGASTDEAAESSEEVLSCGEIEIQECHRTSEDRELKDKLLRKYSGCISTLKQEFSKKKKKGKLPIEARQILLNWWNIHYKWPYPTEGDKIELAEVTGLDQKQINNWFINRRKRHWKPSESMQIAVIDNICGPFYVNG